MSEDPTATVRALLAANGVHPAEEEIAQIAAGYPFLVATLERLYAIDEAREQAPDLIFDAGSDA